MGKLYGSVNGQSKEIKKLYCSVNGVSRRIIKLYGSVNGQTKLIYGKDATIPYGIVYYKATSSSTEVLSVELQSESEFNSLGNGSPRGWTATIGGGTVTVSNNGNNIIVGIEIGKMITSIPNTFLLSCSAFNMPLAIPDNITSIGTQFLASCAAFNQSLTIANSVTTIGTQFMTSCSSFNQPLTIPSNITSIGTGFLVSCNNMTSEVNVGSVAASVLATNNTNFATYSSTAASYTTGIKIAGANRAAWISANPNRTSSPYRKLVDAGH